MYRCIDVLIYFRLANVKSYLYLSRFMIENTVLVKLIGKGKRVTFLIHLLIPLLPLLILNIMIV